MGEQMGVVNLLINGTVVALCLDTRRRSRLIRYCDGAEKGAGATNRSIEVVAKPFELHVSPRCTLPCRNLLTVADAPWGGQSGRNSVQQNVLDAGPPVRNESQRSSG